MKNIFELNSSEQIIREVQETRERKNFIVLPDTKSKKITKEELLKLVNTSYNYKYPNGRIHGLSKDGSYVSHSVSPYSPEFLNNIEEGIKPLVQALFNKGYLSISSCEGHNLSFKRYITIIFPTIESANSFRASFSKFKQLKFKTIHCTNYLNNSVELDENNELQNVKKGNSFKNHNGSVAYVNCFARRNYDDAWFVEMIISPEIQPGIFNYIKNFKEIIFKWFFIDSYTNKLTNFVNKKLVTSLH